MELSGTIDDVTDSIEDVLLRLYMFNIRTLRPEAQALHRSSQTAAPHSRP